jgi:hypothetical protein
MKFMKHKCYTSWVIIFLLANCTIHHLKINEAPAQRFKNSRQVDRKNLELDRIIPALKKGNATDQLTQSYNSDSLVHLLETGCCIEISKKSDYILRYSTNISEDMPFPISPIFFLLTLGIFPVVENADASVKFQVVEKSSERIIKEYNYRTNHKYVTSWLSIIASLFLWGDEWSLSMFNSHSYPQEMLVYNFEKDFILDLHKFDFSTNQSQANERYAILPIYYSHSKDKETSEVIRDKVETLLVKKKYTVLERAKILEITKEFKLSQVGLTRNDQVEIGRMLNASNLILSEILELNKADNKLEFSVKNLEVKSGRIIWKYEFVVNELMISESINEAMGELENRIK